MVVGIRQVRVGDRDGDQAGASRRWWWGSGRLSKLVLQKSAILMLRPQGRLFFRTVKRLAYGTRQQV